MPDQRQIVDEIRAFLATPDRAAAPELAEAAAAYSALCREANGRLRRCIDYLRRGLRSEAIQLAECQPVLLDLVGTLDLPEAAEWEQECVAHGLTRPPRLMMESARELNEAYSDEQPLRDLLARHRVLALGRAPLPERLSVLRELAARDPRNACWEQDVRALEQARLRELAPETLSAVRAGDVVRVDRLLEEVKDKRWRSPVPEELKTALAGASAATHRDGALEALRAMAADVEAACAMGNIPEARRVLQEWCDIVARSGVALPAELRAVIRPLNQMLDADEERREQEKLFRGACVELRDAINAGTPAPELREIYRRAIGFDLPVADALEHDYRRRLADWEREQRDESRRSLLLTVALVVVIGAALAGLAVVIVISSHHG